MNGRSPEGTAGGLQAGDPEPARRDLPSQLVTRLRDLHQVEALLELEAARYREQLAAWRAAEADTPPPPVPDSYREVVARLQIALGHLSTVYDLVVGGGR